MVIYDAVEGVVPRVGVSQMTVWENAEIGQMSDRTAAETCRTVLTSCENRQRVSERV